jgi:hypothetical protein
MLAKKFLASIKALQLEIGCIGSPLSKDYDKFHHLATLSWIKASGNDFTSIGLRCT